MSITAKISEWVCGASPLANGKTLGLARNAMIDIVGCMVAGATDEATRRALAAVIDLGAGPAHVVGGGARLPAPQAALVNGTAAHALDFDDNYHPLSGHATAVLAPAVLALGEERHASGAQVLDAYIAGLEAMSVIGAGVNLAHYELGWHTTSTIGGMGAAAAAARLCGFDPETTTRAISIGFSTAAGSKLQFGTMTKPLHAGMAAMNGLLAARYAAAGITAAPEPLDVPWGFRDLYVGDGSPGYQKAVNGIGDPPALERYGLKVKIHPNCASVHTAVDALLDLMREHDLKSGDIDAIETVVNKVSYENLRFDDPKSEMEARFSMQYAVALAVLKGRMTLADYRADAIGDPEIRAWYPKITMTMAPESDPLPTDVNGREPAETRVTLKDGRMLSKFMQRAKGVLQNPLTANEMWSKFDDCMAGISDRGRIGAIRGALEEFETLTDIGDLMTLLSTGRRH
ncbi:MAG: MmgE/PrpD family protein [Proteobacteria bacterium]|nr:MmgE/PrpD family protein [Pseudomonadota bacterium]